MATLNAKLDTDAAGASAAEETSLARSGKNASGAVTIKSEDGKSAASPSSHSSEKNNSPVPHLVLPTKALMSHLSNNEPSKVVAASAGNGAGSRPTVPPLVFPLANIFEERTPLPVPGHTGAPLYANPESATYLPLSSGSSAQQWDPNDNAPGTVSCTMFHKIRGGKGEWKEIVPWEMIRVTKGVGKKVKMVLEAPGRYGSQDIQLTLNDMTESGRTPRTPAMRCKSSRFIVESTTVGSMDPETGKTSAELIIKLFKLSKQLVFHAIVASRVGHNDASGASTVQRGHTAPFGTHNSGKQRRKGREAAGEEDDGEEDTHTTATGAASSSAAAHAAPPAPTHHYNSRRKQAKLVEQDDDTYIDHPHFGAVNSSSASSSTTGHGSHSSSEEMLDTAWPAEDVPIAQQKEMINQINNMMRDFGAKYLLDEARKRGAGIVVYVACRRSTNQPDDFTTFVYKHENLLREDAVTMGTPLGRALFIPNDDRGDATGVYTLVAAVRSGTQDVTFAPNSGVAAVYDFRRDDDHLMRTLPIHPVWLSHEPTSVWLIGSFQVDPRNINWHPAVQSQPQQPGFPASGRASGQTNGSGSHRASVSAYGTAGGPPVPPLPLGGGLGYHMGYSPRGSLHSPTPYYGATPSSASQYLAPKPMYGGQSPAHSPSSTPVPNGPPTPGLGQTPRGFGDILGHFGGQPGGMMGSGFYSPLSNASYSQPLYMFDPSVLLSARGLQDGSLATPTSASAGFYSPTSGGGLNLANFKSTGGQAMPGYPYNFFQTTGGLQPGLQGYPTSSPRFEELLDSARM